LVHLKQHAQHSVAENAIVKQDNHQYFWTIYLAQAVKIKYGIALIMDGILLLALKTIA